MKKDNIIIAVASFILGSATIVGANQAIQAMQNTEIKISLNGEIQTFKDETTGEVQYPITFHNRTYLPLRNIAQLSELDVDYDANNNEAKLVGCQAIDRARLGDETILLVFTGEGGVYGSNAKVFIETGYTAQEIGSFYVNGEFGGYEIIGDKIYTAWLNHPRYDNNEGVAIGYYYIKDYKLCFNASVNHLKGKEFKYNDMYGCVIIDSANNENLPGFGYEFEENEKLKILDAKSSYDTAKKTISYEFKIERANHEIITVTNGYVVHDGVIVDEIDTANNSDYLTSINNAYSNNKFQIIVDCSKDFFKYEEWKNCEAISLSGVQAWINKYIEESKEYAQNYPDDNFVIYFSVSEDYFYMGRFRSKDKMDTLKEKITTFMRSDYAHEPMYEKSPRYDSEWEYNMAKSENDVEYKVFASGAINGVEYDYNTGEVKTISRLYPGET